MVCRKSHAKAFNSHEDHLCRYVEASPPVKSATSMRARLRVEDRRTYKSGYLLGRAKPVMHHIWASMNIVSSPPCERFQSLLQTVPTFALGWMISSQSSRNEGCIHQRRRRMPFSPGLNRTQPFVKHTVHIKILSLNSLLVICASSFMRGSSAPRTDLFLVVCRRYKDL